MIDYFLRTSTKLNMGVCVKWLALFLLAGCSASQQIATSATAIREYASTIKDQSANIQNESSEPAVISSAKSISATANKIIAEVADIQESIPSVADITPWWATLIKWGFIMVAAIAATFLLIQSGALVWLRLLLNLIPKRVTTEANIAMNALDPAKEDNLTTWISAKRASDPLFNKAWLQAKSERVSDIVTAKEN